MQPADHLSILQQLVEQTSRVERPAGPNPLVGACITSTDGQILAVGVHRGSGTEHAEVDALRQVKAQGIDPRGLTMIVTLEPCNHWGRTPPCTDAILSSGIGTVIYAAPDPTLEASGGAHALEAAGVCVIGPIDPDAGRSLDPRWFSAMALGRPHVTWKAACSLDGYCGDSWGQSKWVTDKSMRAHGRQLRAEHDAILVGTQTVIDDNPQLTYRGDDAASVTQPLRVVIGKRDIPSESLVFDSSAPTMHLRTHDARNALKQLWEKGVRRALIEGGPTLASNFLRLGLVDELHLYVSPTLLSGGRPLCDIGAQRVNGAPRLHLVSTQQVGGGVLLELARE